MINHKFDEIDSLCLWQKQPDWIPMIMALLIGQLLTYSLHNPWSKHLKNSVLLLKSTNIFMVQSESGIHRNLVVQAIPIDPLLIEHSF